MEIYLLNAIYEYYFCTYTAYMSSQSPSAEYQLLVSDTGNNNWHSLKFHEITLSSGLFDTPTMSNRQQIADHLIAHSESTNFTLKSHIYSWYLCDLLYLFDLKWSEEAKCLSLNWKARKASQHASICDNIEWKIYLTLVQMPISYDFSND